MTASSDLARINRLHRLASSIVDELEAMRTHHEAETRRKHGRPDEVIAAVAEVMDITPADILGKSRVGLLVKARAVVCLVLHKVGMPYSVIGRCMVIDHSTVMHACRRAQEYVHIGPRAPSLARAYEAGLAAWGTDLAADMSLLPQPLPDPPSDE